MADSGANNVYLQELMGGMYGPNQYSQFQGRIPLPGYAGTPTDAQGNPIRPPPGVTLNSAPAAAPAPAASQGMFNDPAANAALRSQLATLAAQGMGGPGAAQAQKYRDLMTGQSGLTPLQGYQAYYTPSSPAPAAQAAGAAPSSLDQAISMLSNPGKVTTPGATVPQSQIGNQPSVLQQFLANNRGGTGAGNYSNQGFFDTLNALGRK
jgi:hypothetical protein